MPEATVMVLDHEQKEGTTSKGRPWVLTRMQDGNGEWYSTFDKGMGITILGLKGKKADITYEVGEKGRDLKSITEHFEVKKAGGEYQRELSPVAQRRVSILNTIGHATATINAASAERGEKLDVGERWRRTKILAVQMMDFSFELAEKDPDDVPFSGAVEDDGIPFGEPEGG